MHSCGYKSPEIFQDRRVLVVGAGNSGCDIAVEAGRHAERAFLSVRRGYHFIPKYAFGRPTDQVGEVGHRLRLPLGVRRGLNDLVLRTVVGRPEDYGLPRPDHRLLESHPIVNSEILPAIRRGEVRPKPDLVELRGREAVFRDGTSEPIDLIVFATGYRVTFPFLDARDLNSTDGRPNFYLHTFHPTYDDLFIVGNLQPDSGVWPLMDLQARAVAGYIGGAGAHGRGVRELRARKVRALARSVRGASVRSVRATPVRGGACQLRPPDAVGDPVARVLIRPPRVSVGDWALPLPFHHGVPPPGRRAQPTVGIPAAKLEVRRIQRPLPRDKRSGGLGQGMGDHVLRQHRGRLPCAHADIGILAGVFGRGAVLRDVTSCGLRHWWCGALRANGPGRRSARVLANRGRGGDGKSHRSASGRADPGSPQILRQTRQTSRLCRAIRRRAIGCGRGTLTDQSVGSAIYSPRDPPHP